MMGRIVQAINDLGVQVEHIPGGCTGLCQPIDIGVCKPLKNRIHARHDAWLVAQGPGVRRIAPPSRSVVADWVVSSVQALPQDIIERSWRHDPFSFFEIDNGGANNAA